ncbi:hypothetical protein BDW75DRAFT_221708 [Aspergillus navahoensis]
MPALIESNSENKRPRKPSITQQLQRMFYIDKPVDNGSYEDSFAPHPSARRGDDGSFDYANYGPSEINSTGNSRHSHSSLNSKVTDLHTLQSRRSSLQSFHLEPHPDPPKQDIGRSTTTNHSVVQKKDRRATKRLEAERLELEKRLLKLEEAERTGDTSILRRESRRLSKKQPLGSSSRSSSVSGDESRSRAPSRLSSIFSSSRRRSRSRCSSIEGVDNQSKGHDEPNTLPVLSPTLPERLSTAISKELATRKNALLVSPEESSQSLDTATESTPSQLTSRNGEEHDFTTNDNIQSDKFEFSRRKDAHQQADLDRALFTASLISKNGRALSGHASRGQTAYHHLERPRADNDPLQVNSTSHSMPRNPLSRAPADGIVQRQQKKFKSSPLAESQTISVDKVPSERATTLTSFDVLDTVRLQKLSVAGKAARSETHKLSTLQSSGGTSENITVNPSLIEVINARNRMSRMPTSKPTSPSGDKPKATVSLSPRRRERDCSPTVPPKSPERNSRTLSQTPDMKPDSRPTSSLSIGKSQESESDYNTADEIASTISRISDDDDLHAPEGTGVSEQKTTGSDDAAGIVNGKGGPKKTTKKRNLGQLVPKLFVICCRCKFWHDIPSEVYASLTVSDPLSAALDQELAAWEPNSLADRLLQVHSSHESSTELPRSELQQRSLRTRVTTDTPPGPVKCCWCEHHISKGCCQGWSTLVQLRQRHH